MNLRVVSNHAGTTIKVSPHLTMHVTCNINKLNDRRQVHLLNFVYKRAHEAEYVQGGNRGLRRFDAPVLKETRSNNKSFERSILFQGALAWNGQTVKDRNTVNHKAFKKMQKRKLNTILPYGGP